jgi:MFS family permease
MSQNRKIIYLAGFLFSLPIALASYINSSFISSFVGDRFVGIIYVAGSVGSIIALLLAPTIFRKVGVYKFLLSATILNAFSFLMLSFTESAWVAILMFMLGFSMNTLIVFSLDEILKILSRNPSMGRIRGIYLTVCNLSWVLAQLVFGAFLGGFSLNKIYLVSFSIMILFFLVSFINLRNIPDPKYDKVSSFRYIKKFFKNKNLRRAYGINFLLQFFYAWMVIYTPLYLSMHLGFAWKEIGFIFMVMLMPFVLIQYPLGKHSDKFGERKMLMVGFGISALATLSLFLITKHSILIWALLLFMTRVGAATIEVMSDVHFFKHIKPENEEYVGVYRTSSPIAYILGPVFAFLFFLFIPAFNYIFLILGTLMLFGIYLSSTIKKNDI